MEAGNTSCYKTQQFSQIEGQGLTGVGAGVGTGVGEGVGACTGEGKIKMKPGEAEEFLSA
jgi:hypothetical protein